MKFLRGGGIAGFIIRRVLLGLLVLFLVSVIVFVSTQLLGDPARAILGRDATPDRLAALHKQLHLDSSKFGQYFHWLGGLLHGDLGTSLASSQPVTSVLGSRIANSAVLVVLAAVISVPISIAIGSYAALRREKLFDTLSSNLMLLLAALPEFVVAVLLVILLSTNVLHLLPATSPVPPGSHAWDYPKELVMPVATLVIAVAPYVSRIMRASMIERLRRIVIEHQAADFVEEIVVRGLVDRDRTGDPFEHQVHVVGKDFLAGFAGRDQRHVHVVDLRRALLDHRVEDHVQRVVPRKLPFGRAQAVGVLLDPSRRAIARIHHRITPGIHVALFLGTPANVELCPAVALADDLEQLAHIVRDVLLDRVEPFEHRVDFVGMAGGEILPIERLVRIPVARRLRSRQVPSVQTRDGALDLQVFFRAAEQPGRRRRPPIVVDFLKDSQLGSHRSSSKIVAMHHGCGLSFRLSVSLSRCRVPVWNPMMNRPR